MKKLMELHPFLHYEHWSKPFKKPGQVGSLEPDMQDTSDKGVAHSLI